MFYDLNVQWVQNQTELQKTLFFLAELGYNVIALNHILSGKLPSEIVRHSLPNPLNHLLNIPPKQTSPIPHPLPFSTPPHLRILHRCTLLTTDPSQNHRFPDLLRAYDLVALRPTDEATLHQACTALDCDLISLDLTQRLAFPLRFRTLGAAVARGVRVEIAYGPGVLASETAARRNLIGNATQLVRATRGRGLVLSSEAARALGCRAPWDVVNLAAVWGLGAERGKEAVTSGARHVVVAAQLRRTSYRGVIEVVEGREVPERQKKTWGKGEQAGQKKRKVGDTGDQGGRDKVKTKKSTILQGSGNGKKARLQDKSAEAGTEDTTVLHPRYITPLERLRLAQHHDSSNTTELNFWIQPVCFAQLLPRSCVTAVESITVLMLTAPGAPPAVEVNVELVVDPVDDVTPDVLEEVVPEMELVPVELVVLVAVGFEDSEKDLVTEFELPDPSCSDVDVVAVDWVVKAVWAIIGIIVDMVLVVKKENGHWQEQRHPLFPTDALAAAAVDSCVAFVKEFEDKAKVNIIEEPPNVTLAPDVLFAKAAVVPLLTANDRALFDEFEFVFAKAVPVALLTANERALFDEFVFVFAKAVPVALLTANERALFDEFVFAFAKVVAVAPLTANERAFLDELLFEEAVFAALLTAKDRAPVGELPLPRVDVGARLVDAAAAVADRLEEPVPVDVTWKDSADKLDVALEKLVPVDAAAAVATPFPPESTEMVRIWPEEPVPVFKA
ncbi:MAG: Ribonuclease P protein subunit p30 [Bathelium mastoideum]|nr:MAG: Ribonuclease P protein subunit p30 [Bathelium mastoideum]